MTGMEVFEVVCWVTEIGIPAARDVAEAMKEHGDGNALERIRAMRAQGKSPEEIVAEVRASRGVIADKDAI
jgi:alkylated DNA nucleotide flippase Atl1